MLEHKVDFVIFHFSALYVCDFNC